MLPNLKRNDILNKTRVGLEIEFYSILKNEQLTKKLSKVLDKEVEFINDYHSGVTPTAYHFKLEKDFSGGNRLYELVTGPLDYKEAVSTINRAFSFIKEWGYTTKSSSIHLNVSFKPIKESYYTHNNQLNNFNVLKFILNFDEEYIYERFPERRNSIYARSIKTILPRHYSTFDVEEGVIHKNFDMPNRKYYGINFLHLKDNYLELRYLGGEGYQFRENKIVEILDYFVNSMYENTQNNSLTTEEVNTLKEILNKNQRQYKAVKNLKSFNKQYPKIELTVNMSDLPGVVDSHFSSFHEVLFETLVKSNIKVGKINWDSDRGKLQIKDALLNPVFSLQGADLVDCKVSGYLIECDLHGCTIYSSELKKCNIYNTNIKNSKVMNSFTNKSSEITDCFVSGPHTLFNGTMNAGIFREGSVFEDAEISEKTEIVKIKKLEKGY